MLVSDSARFLFVHIPKTAGSSLTYHLTPYVEERYRQSDGEVYNDGPGWQATWHFRRGQHHRAEVALGRLEEEGMLEDVKGHRLCTFVRDPYEWVVSVWQNFHSLPDTPVGAAMEDFSPDDLSFSAFLQMLRQNEDPQVWGSAGQLSFLRNDCGIEPSFIGRFEDLHRESARLFTHLGLEVPSELIHKVNHGPTGRHDLAGLYQTEENVRFVERKYAEDFETFGYSKREIL